LRTTRVVFILISILIFAPVIFLQGRTIFRKWKEKQTRQALLRLGAAVVLCLALLVFIISLYRFTLGYQAPLVVERIVITFTEKLEQNMDTTQYTQILLDNGLIDTDFQPISEIDLEHAGFQEGNTYDVFIGEQTFDGDEDNTVVLYVLHKNREGGIYTAVELKSYGNKWKAVKHRVVVQEELDEISGMKYYEIKR